MQSLALADDEDLRLPALVAVDADLGAAVVRREDGKLAVIRRADPVGSGPWKLDSITAKSVVLVSTVDNDLEAGTRVRVFIESESSPPQILRQRAPPPPLAPRLVWQTGVMKPVVTDSADRSKDGP